MTTASRLAARIEAQCGCRVRAMDTGDTPTAIEARPESPEQAAEILRTAHDDGAAVLPAGGGSWRVAMHAPHQPLVRLSTAGLNRVLDFPAADMTITVQAGLSRRELADITTAAGLQLACGASHGATGTIGGLLAVQPADALRRSCGLVGNAVLGGTLVLADGRVAHSGARTVKSVAGYDLHKLFVGSCGALGLLTEVHLKLRPIPECTRVAWKAIASLDQALHQAAAVLHGSTRPDVVEVCATLNNALQLPEEDAVLIVAYGDHPAAVDWQLEQLQQHLPGAWTVCDATESGALLRRVCDCAADCASPFEMELLQQHFAAVMKLCMELDVPAIADVAARCIRGQLTPDTAPRTAQALRQAAGPRAGLRVFGVGSASAEWAWDIPPAQRRWMTAMKAAFDPKWVLPAPGFLMGGPP